jgi:type II secretory pathway component PulM
MLAIASTIAFLFMVVAWATVEPARSRMSRTTSKVQQVRTQTQSVQS